MCVSLSYSYFSLSFATKICIYGKKQIQPYCYYERTSKRNERKQKCTYNQYLKMNCYYNVINIRNTMINDQ